MSPLPSVTFRSELDPVVRKELDQLDSELTSYLLEEHDDDGHHTAISATSLKVNGPTTFNGPVTGLPSPLSSSVFFYRVDLTSVGVSDPGAGKFKYNHAVQASATTLIFDWISDDGFDVHVLFQLFGPATRILIQERDFANNYQVWQLSAPATNLADFFTVPVTFVSSGGSGVFSQGKRVAIIILP